MLLIFSDASTDLKKTFSCNAQFPGWKLCLIELTPTFEHINEQASLRFSSRMKFEPIFFYLRVAYSAGCARD